MIGTHISKNKGFLGSISQFYEKESTTKPIQIFTGSPKFWKRPVVSDEEAASVKEFIDKNAVRVFAHSIYLINLSWDPDKFRENPRKCLVWEMKNGVRMGFLGVVVHCGKSCKLPKEQALDNMYNNIIDVLSEVDPRCPLLLETSTGQGTELCYQYDEFKQFYERFAPELRTRLKICIDTCHVFAAGNDPMKFILDWNSSFPNTLVLVHYNDSKGICGCKKDRHETPGQGEIGADIMKEIAEWCIKNDIPMVVE